MVCLSALQKKCDCIKFGLLTARLNDNHTKKYESFGKQVSGRKISHLGHCWAKPAGAAPKGVIAPILRNDPAGGGVEEF